MAIPSASLTGAPTNKMILKGAMLVSWVVIMGMVDIHLSSQRHLHQLSTTMQPTVPPHRLSLFGYPYVERAQTLSFFFTQLVLRGSMIVSSMSLLVLLGIMTELSLNWRNGIRRPINLYHEACVRAIFCLSGILLIVRIQAVRSVTVEFVCLQFTGLFLIILVENLGTFLRWVNYKVVRS